MSTEVNARKKKKNLKQSLYKKHVAYNYQYTTVHSKMD